MTRPQPAPKLTEAQRRILRAVVAAVADAGVPNIAYAGTRSVARLARTTPQAAGRVLRLLLVRGHVQAFSGAYRVAPAGLSALAALEAADPLSPDDAEAGR